MNKRFKMFEVCVLATYITITTTAPIESHRNPPSYSATACSNLTRAEQNWHGDWWIIFQKKTIFSCSVKETGMESSNNKYKKAFLQFRGELESFHSNGGGITVHEKERNSEISKIKNPIYREIIPSCDFFWRTDVPHHSTVSVLLHGKHTPHTHTHTHTSHTRGYPVNFYTCSCKVYVGGLESEMVRM